MSSKLQSLRLDFIKIICAKTVKFCMSRMFIKLTPKRTILLWGPYSLLSGGYPARIHREYKGRGFKIIRDLHLVPRLVTRAAVSDLFLSSLVRLHAVTTYCTTPQLLPATLKAATTRNPIFHHFIM